MMSRLCHVRTIRLRITLIKKVTRMRQTCPDSGLIWFKACGTISARVTADLNHKVKLMTAVKPPRITVLSHYQSQNLVTNSAGEASGATETPSLCKIGLTSA